MSKILFDVKAVIQSQWYDTSNIHYENGPVTVQKYLCIMFHSPASVSNADFNPSTDPWVEVTPDITSQQIGASLYLVTAKLQFAAPYTFNGIEVFTFYINGNLNSDPHQFTETFILTADHILSGTVTVQCAQYPDPALVFDNQAVTFTEGPLVITETVTPGWTTLFQIVPGTYTVTAAELTNQNQTVVAIPKVSPSTITVVDGETTIVDVTYSEVNQYSAIDVTIGNMSPPLENELFNVTVSTFGNTLTKFWSPANHTTPSRRLPSANIVDVDIANITLNNIEYSFNTQSIDASPSLFHVTFSEPDHIGNIYFVTLPIVVTTDVSLEKSITVRLVGSSPANLIYTQEVEVKAGTTNFAVPVAPGKYNVQASVFILDHIVYVVDIPATLTVSSDGTVLPLKILRGPNLKVPGFPDFLSFGGITDLTSGNEADFVEARASEIFKYAGVSGNGDPTLYLDSDEATKMTIKLAYDVGQKLQRPVLPIMVSYTCDLSGGDFTNLQSADKLAHSFGNLIVSLTDANETMTTSPVRAVGYIVNPDFLGACQQKGLAADYEMPVRQPLQHALDYRGVQAEIPDSITDTLRGYVLAVNWLVRTMASKVTFMVTFGWQVNIWGGGTADWIYFSTINPADPAKKTADYIRDLGVNESTHPPDFLAVDRYEADDFTLRALSNGTFYGPFEWPRFFEFCKWLSVGLQLPVVPWQIPCSRTPNVKDYVVDPPYPQHWGTCGTYMLGDVAIGSDYHNVNPILLALPGTEAMFIQGEPFNWALQACRGFPLLGIPAVLLGGGQTTGIVSDIGNAGPWVLQRLHDYMDNPVPLDNSN